MCVCVYSELQVLQAVLKVCNGIQVTDIRLDLYTCKVSSARVGIDIMVIKQLLLDNFAGSRGAKQGIMQSPTLSATYDKKGRGHLI